MDEAVISGVDQAIVQYTANVTAGDFTPADFASLPSTETGTSVAQLGAAILTITFSGVITGDTDIQYVGTDPPAVTPQTLTYN